MNRLLGIQKTFRLIFSQTTRGFANGSHIPVKTVPLRSRFHNATWWQPACLFGCAVVTSAGSIQQDEENILVEWEFNGKTCMYLLLLELLIENHYSN